MSSTAFCISWSNASNRAWTFLTRILKKHFRKLLVSLFNGGPTIRSEPMNPIKSNLMNKASSVAFRGLNLINKFKITADMLNVRPAWKNERSPNPWKEFEYSFLERLCIHLHLTAFKLTLEINGIPPEKSSGSIFATIALGNMFSMKSSSSLQDCPPFFV